MTNVAKTIATVSPIGMPIKSSAVEFPWIKHCRHIPLEGGGCVDDGGAGVMLRTREAVVAVPDASVRVSVVV